MTINSGGHPDNTIHFEGSNSGARLDIHVQTDLHMQAGNNITLEAKSINLVATKAISIKSDDDSISTHAKHSITETAETGYISSNAETDVGVHAVTGQLKLTAAKDVTIKGGPNVTVHADHIGLND